MNRHVLLLFAIFAGIQSAAVPGEEAPAGKPLTIVTLGDSTTAPRGKLKIYAECLKEDLPKRGLKVNVLNAGVGGHSTADAAKRFEKDVTSKHPDLVIIQFGINDSTINVWKDPPDTKAPVSREQYVAQLEKWMETLRKANCQVILMTPNPMRWTPQLVKLYGKPPYLPQDSDGLNVTLIPYVQGVRDLAKKHKVPLVDVYAEFQKHGQLEGKSVDGLLLDGMHPNDDGQRKIANLLIETILKLQGRSQN